MSVELSRRDVMAAAGAAATSAAAGPVARSLGKIRPGSAIAAPASWSRRSPGGRSRRAKLVDKARFTRIEALDPKINAVVVARFRASARITGRRGPTPRWRAAKRRPLLGLPMTVKEQHGVAGPADHRAATPKFKGWKAEVDGPGGPAAQSRWGQSSSARPNVPIAMRDWQSYNEVYGTTNNPWDTSRSSWWLVGRRRRSHRRRLRAARSWAPTWAARCAARRISAASSRTKPSLDLVTAARSGPTTVAVGAAARRSLPFIGPMARSAADLRAGIWQS